MVCASPSYCALDDRAERSYVGKMGELRRLPLVRTLLLAFLSLLLVVASLGIEQTAHNRSEAQDLGFGYPLHFAFSDFTTYSSPQGYPQTYNLNPWEIPMEENALTFLISWVLTYAALLGCWLLAAKALRRSFRRRARAPRAST